MGEIIGASVRKCCLTKDHVSLQNDPAFQSDVQGLEAQDKLTLPVECIGDGGRRLAAARSPFPTEAAPPLSAPDNP